MPPAAVGPPPCCSGCAAYDHEDRVCRLLAEPSLDNRRALLTMPCNVQRLLEIRFRSYGPDVARDALVAFLDPAWDPDDVSLSYGRAPRDARLFLGSWPYYYLARNSIRRIHREDERTEPGDDDPRPAGPPADPTLGLRMTRALAAVQAIDPVGYAMILDFLHDRFDAQGWATMLGWAAASVTDRKYLSIYRYAVAFHDVLSQVSPREAATALAARRFAAGDPSEHDALAATRAALGAPALTMAAYRQLYREGASLSLTLLAEPEALGAEAMAEMGTAFRRVLRLDTGGR